MSSDRGDLRNDFLLRGALGGRGPLFPAKLLGNCNCFRSAASVAGLGDKGLRTIQCGASIFVIFLGEQEAGVFEVGIGLQQEHVTTGRNAQGFVQVTRGSWEVADAAEEGGTVDQAAWQVVLCPRLAQARHSLVEVMRCGG